MIKHELVVDEVELNNKGEQVAWKGRVVKVYDIDNFMSHIFKQSTLKSMFWAQFEIDYIGG